MATRDAAHRTGAITFFGFGLVVAAVLFTSRAAQAGTWIPGVGGIYALMDQGSIPSAALSNSNVDGIKVRWWWDQVEPIEGSFIWSGIDAEVAQAKAAGKKISISFAGSFRTPAWVYSDGAQSFPFIFDQSWGPGYCVAAKTPIPWDAVYLAKWGAFIAAAGSHFGSDFAYVNANGINYTTGEIMLPHNVGKQPINGGQCYSLNDTANWQAVSYTRTKVEAAWRQMQKAFANAFPASLVGGQWLSTGFPPLDSYGNQIAGASVDTQCPIDLVNYGIAYFPNNLAQNNALTTTRAGWPYINNVATQTVTGYQMARAWNNASGLLTAGNLGINAGAKFLEIYMPDINNPKEQSVLATLHASIAAKQ
jgi:hypothetical protein